MNQRPNALHEHPEPGQSALQRKFEVCIFGTSTPAGRRFDMALIAVILMSVIVVILDLIPELDVPSDVREQAQRYEW